MKALAAALALLLAMVLAAGAQASVLRTPDKLRTGVKAGKLVLSWRDRARGESRYEVRYRLSGRARTRRLSAGKTRFTLAVPVGTQVSLRVRACSQGGCSKWSRSISFSATGGSGTTTGGQPSVGGCPVFPASDPWNQDVSGLPVDPRSDRYIASISAAGDRFLHADFGGGGAYGIPYAVVPQSQATVPINFTAYGDESDPGPYPVPLDAPVENGGDRHVLVVRQGECKLYELYAAQRSGAGWNADSGAVFDLRNGTTRPRGWTSADAAGLPILPGLARYDEVAAGTINHALRFTVQDSQRGFIFPARHFASGSDDPDLPPMGLRLRLKASYDVSGFGGEARVILEALKRYGMIVADNGTSWYVTGASDQRWNDEDLDQLKTVPGSAFEAVQTGPIER